MKRITIYLIFALFAVLATSCSAEVQTRTLEPDLGPTPTLRVLMEASDPATFEIAAGKPQLVEFFAFW